MICDMKKNNTIAIVTLYGLYNYGNRLQNYAMQRIINRLGYQTETITSYGRRYKWIWLKNQIKYLFRKVVKQWNNDITIRRKKFLTFERNISHSRFSLNNIAKNNLLNDYDYVVYGSDQIWNAEFSTFSKLYLGYYSKKSKNIAVSASFGTSDIDVKYKEMFNEGLQNFKAISVREESGKRIIEDYTGTECIVTVDPTIAITMDEWIEVEREVITPDRYALTYFLGESPEIDVNTKEYNVIDCGKQTANGPAEFIYLIHHAERVYTDSFHACVFSIIFCVPFLVYKRKGEYSSMMSRIDTLLNQFEIRYIEENETYYVSKEELCKPHTNKRLNELRTILEDYIKKSTG